MLWASRDEMSKIRHQNVATKVSDERIFCDTARCEDIDRMRVGPFRKDNRRDAVIGDHPGNLPMDDHHCQYHGDHNDGCNDRSGANGAEVDQPDCDIEFVGSHLLPFSTFKTVSVSVGDSKSTK